MVRTIESRAEELSRGLGFPVIPYDTEVDTKMSAIHGDAVVVDADDLAMVLNPPFHILDVNEEGDWAIQHPLACRGAMLECAVHQAMMLEEDPLDAGAYKTRISNSGTLYFERLDEREKAR